MYAKRECVKNTHQIRQNDTVGQNNTHGGCRNIRVFRKKCIKRSQMLTIKRINRIQTIALKVGTPYAYRELRIKLYTLGGVI